MYARDRLPLTSSKARFSVHRAASSSTGRAATTIRVIQLRLHYICTSNILQNYIGIGVAVLLYFLVVISCWYTGYTQYAGSYQLGWTKYFVDCKEHLGRYVQYDTRLVLTYYCLSRYQDARDT